MPRINLEDPRCSRGRGDQQTSSRARGERRADPEIQVRRVRRSSDPWLIVEGRRSRVNFFMNKFRDLGLIEYNGEIKVNSSLLTVVLHD
jgi:hypothetical protein